MAKTALHLLVPAVALVIGGGAGWYAAEHRPGATASTAEVTQNGPLALGTSHRGEITSSSTLNAKDGSRFERVTLTLEADSLVELELDGALHGALSLYDTEGNFLAASPEDATPTRLRRRIDDSGDYVVAISGRDRHSYGPFRLTSRHLEVQNTGALTLGTPTNGWLQESSNQYEIVIDEPGLYEIGMDSDDIDAYLVLTDAQGTRREDDDSGSNLSARLSDFLDAGRYQLEARTLQGDGTGHYTLTMTQRSLPGDVSLTQAGELPLGETLQGWYSGSPLDYHFELTESTRVTLEMRSSDIDAYLELNSETLSLEDDDGAGGHDARIQRILPSGSYTVTARSYDNTGSGLFTLASSRDALPATATSSLEVGTPIDAMLEYGARHYYGFHIEQPGRYSITMSSSVVDAFLELEGEQLRLEDDDSGGGYDARIRTHLEPGDYRLVARSFGGSDSGPYRLVVEIDGTRG